MSIGRKLLINIAIRQTAEHIPPRATLNASLSFISAAGDKVSAKTLTAAVRYTKGGAAVTAGH